MDLKPLGKRDIFGILLPGALLALVSAYVLFGVLVVLQLPSTSLLEREILLAVVLFVAAYLVGSILRLHAADDVDQRSSDRFVRSWHKDHDEKVQSAWEKLRGELARGEDVSGTPDGFDEWLLRVEKFPYPASMNRLWKAQGLNQVLDFYRTYHKTSMWSQGRVSAKSFFLYCKLAIIKGDRELTDEINMAEGLTRFFAGTFAALWLSTWVLCAGLFAHAFFVATLIFAPWWGIKLPFSAQWTFQGFCVGFTLVLIFVLQRVCRLIVERFRWIRMKEAETVWYAFYLQSASPDRSGPDRDETALQETSS